MANRPKLTTLPRRIALLPPRMAQPAKVADPFYDSPKFKALRSRIILMRGRVCEGEKSKWAAETGGWSPKDCKMVDGKLPYYEACIADHIDEIREGCDPLDGRNIQLLCISCHNKKTAWASKKRFERRY